MANKIKFGLRNVRYYVIEDDGTEVVYGEANAIPGAVSISLTANGEISEFFADDITYFSTEANNGYDGDLEIADLPAEFAADVLGQVQSTNGLVVENADTVIRRFGMSFEVQGDQEPRRYVLYNCIATRPTIASTTRGTTIEPQTSSLTLQARPHPYNQNIKAYVDRDVNPTSFNALDTTMVEPTTAP